MSRDTATWKNASTGKVYNCTYGSCSNGDMILKGTYLYHAGTKVALGADRDEEAGLLRPFVYFSTVRERCAQFGGEIQVFQLSQNLPATYTGVRGGDEHAQDFFKINERVAYFSNKECEVVIATRYLDQYLEHPTSIAGSIWYYLTCCLPCCGAPRHVD